jgi:phage terminase small subunit
MPTLKNPRYEQFALELFKGLGQGGGAVSHSAAYTAAGYTKNRRSAKVQACRLLQNCPAIIERVKELQAEVAKVKKVTVEAIVDELETARAMAEKNERESAMVAASLGKARVLGLEPPAKSEVGRPGDFSTAKSTKDMARAELAALGCTDPTDDQVAMAVDAMARYAANCEAIAAQSKPMGTAPKNSLTSPNHHPEARRH